MPNLRSRYWAVIVLLVAPGIVLATYSLPSLLAYVIALWAIFLFEWIKRPSLEIDLPQNRYAAIPEIPNVRQRARMAHLTALNRPIYQNWIQRNTATNCKSKITVKDEAGNILHNQVETKWAATQEPWRMVALSASGQPVFHIEEYLVGQCDRLDLHPKYDGELFSVAVKIVGDADCYLFRGESYRSENQWRLSSYRIPLGTFILEVFVEADNGRSPMKKYRLLNNGTNPEDLTLESI